MKGVNLPPHHQDGLSFYFQNKIINLQIDDYTITQNLGLLSIMIADYCNDDIQFTLGQYLAIQLLNFPKFIDKPLFYIADDYEVVQTILEDMLWFLPESK